jgi:initiation factor 1A
MVKGNLRGGKAFKKGKKGGGQDDGEGGRNKFAGLEEDQQYGRVLRALGDRRMLCFCNDGVDRICKIRGKLCRGPGKQRIEVGDIVILSFRDFEDEDSDSDVQSTPKKVSAPLSSLMESDNGTRTITGTAATLANGKKDIADIVHKIPTGHWKYVRKESGIHKLLFPDRVVGEDDTMDDLFEREEAPAVTNELNIDDI